MLLGLLIKSTVRLAGERKRHALPAVRRVHELATPITTITGRGGMNKFRRVDSRRGGEIRWIFYNFIEKTENTPSIPNEYLGVDGIDRKKKKIKRQLDRGFFYESFDRELLKTSRGLCTLQMATSRVKLRSH